MRLFRLVPDHVALDFMRVHLLSLAVALVLVVGSLGLLMVRGLNLGIDFLGGIMIEAQMHEEADITSLRTELGGLGLGQVALQSFGAPDTVLIRVQQQGGGEGAQQQAVVQLKGSLGEKVREYRRVETVGPTVGEELREAALIAIAAALGIILLYIWFRFEWQYGIGAILALSHDVITIVGFYSLTGFDFNISTIAAILAVAGYSINDTVVVYDRVRENMRKFRKMPLPELFNRSINETLSRTALTTTTTGLALLALVAFGGPIIREFALALLWGITIGTFSSVVLAVPLLLYLKPHRGVDDEGA